MAYFKEKNKFENRIAESSRIKEKFPGRIPVIVERGPKSQVPLIDKNKFLVPGDLSVGQFIYIIRKRLTLSPETALFIYISNVLPITSTLMKELYAQYKDNDGFLYLLYTGENTFG
jgi:GABA(A) receptor-associated protein